MTPPEYARGDSITNGTLYRRIVPDSTCFQKGQATSQVFAKKAEDAGVSAHLAELTNPQEVLAGQQGFGLAEISVEAVAEAGFEVKFEPKDGEPGHVVIYGKFSLPNRRKLSRASHVLIPPTLP